MRDRSAAAVWEGNRADFLSFWIDQDLLQAWLYQTGGVVLYVLILGIQVLASPPKVKDVEYKMTMTKTIQI